jgi:hypothetical protein
MLILFIFDRRKYKMNIIFRNGSVDTKVFHDAKIVDIEFNDFPNEIGYYVDYTENSFVRGTSRVTISVPHNPKFDNKIIIDKADILKKVRDYIAHTHASNFPIHSIHNYVIELLLGEYVMVEKKSDSNNEPSMRELADTFIDMLTVVPQIIKSGGKPNINKSGNEVLKETARKVRNRPAYPPKRNTHKNCQMVNIDRPMTVVVPEPNGSIQVLPSITITGIVVNTNSVAMYYTRSGNPCGASPMECVLTFKDTDIHTVYETITKYFNKAKSSVIDFVNLQEVLTEELGAK